MSHPIAYALQAVFQPSNFLVMMLGAVIGIVFGAVPGLTATLAIALLIPFTIGLPAIPALLLLLAIYCGGMYGGSITAITIRTPGTPAAAATVLDGYPLAQKGQPGKAIGAALIASTFGGLVSALIMIFLSPPLARFALAFSPAEYAAVGVFGLTTVFAVSGKSLLKGAMAAAFGLLLSTIGLDPILPVPRFTFGSLALAGGVPFLPAVIGFFAMAEVLRLAGAKNRVQVVNTNIGRVWPTLDELKRILKAAVRGSLIGTWVGILPGAGGTIAAYMAYGEARRTSRNPELFGTGIIEGIAAPESANNAVSGGAMIPMLTLGIPGDAVTAVLLGALTIQGLQPGPMLFKDNLDVIYPIFAGMILANLIMFAVGFFLIKPVTLMATIRKEYLVATVAVFSIIGAFAESGSTLQVMFAIAFGVLGYFMEKYGYPVAPVVLSLILGPMIENAVRQALIMSHGSWSIFVTRPISATLLLVAVLTMAVMVRRQLVDRRAQV
ncbi:MAG: C4-dicarboxylate ABC transporter permease [Firmicutes bacterium]|nr:C4-dicarboxylate ABC transporter permease [Bacillota bacterium]